MASEDLRRIMVGELPDPTPIMPSGADLEAEVKSLKEVMSFIRKRVANRSELDAAVRVVFIISKFLKDDAVMHFQPSVESHPGYTDICIIHSGNKEPMTIIEIKKLNLYTNISIEVNSTAQVVREVHVLFQNCQELNQIPFIITNTQIWSFGLGVRKGSRVQVTKCCNVHLDIRFPKDEDLKALAQCLIRVLAGEWVS